MLFTTADTSSGEASGLTDDGMRDGAQQQYVQWRTNLKLTFYAVLVPLSILLLHHLVSLESFDELSMDKGNLSEVMVILTGVESRC